MLFYGRKPNNYLLVSYLAPLKILQLLLDFLGRTLLPSLDFCQGMNMSNFFSKKFVMVMGVVYQIWYSWVEQKVICRCCRGQFCRNRLTILPSIWRNKCIQQTFLSSFFTVGILRDFVRSHLADADLPFYLCKCAVGNTWPYFTKSVCSCDVYGIVWCHERWPGEGFFLPKCGLRMQRRYNLLT